ncbi:MAG: type II toxin-antitoxin system HicA family toxin [bacterium]|nr:type II toxin-antitoxin system HicA family toxin [bacterium]
MLICVQGWIVKRQKLEQHLRGNSCELHRHGSRHDIYINLKNKKTTAVPRHKEVNLLTIRSICKDLSIPLVS